MKMNPTKTLLATAMLAALAQHAALADDAVGTTASATPSWKPDTGKLLATGGVSTVEGAAGGGITPWALIAGYGTRDSYGADVHYTYLSTQDFSLNTYGVAVGIADRVEFSVAKQDSRPTAARWQA